MNKCILLLTLLLFLFLVGCTEKLPPIESQTPTLIQQMESGKPVLESPSLVKNMTHADNSNADWEKMLTPFCYEICEIFHGAETVSFGDTLYYRRDYAQNFNEHEGYKPTKFICEITLPYAVDGEPWAAQINDYYRSMQLDLVKAGDDMWNGYTGDYPLSGYSYDYTGSYRISNVISIIHTQYHDAGWRPSLNWMLFTDLFSTLDGQRLELDDLFSVESEKYLPILYASLLNAENRFGRGYSPEQAYWYKSAWNDQKIESFDRASVAVTPVGLVFIYPTGTAADNATGVVFLDVPYAELQGLLNPLYFSDNGSW